MNVEPIKDVSFKSKTLAAREEKYLTIHFETIEQLTAPGPNFL